jgi:spectinomycin phosphotransferase
MRRDNEGGVPMREPPGDLANDTLRACLRDHYGLGVAALAFLPMGHDTAAWAYRALADDGRAYFLKVRARIANAAGLLVPRHLRDHGLAGVVAPLPAMSGGLWAPAGRYAAALYPFVSGGQWPVRTPDQPAQVTSMAQLLSHT